MNKLLSSGPTAFLALLLAAPASASDGNRAFSPVGSWLLTSSVDGAEVSAPFEVVENGQETTAESGPLDLLQYCPLRYRGTTAGGSTQLDVSCRDQPVGSLVLRPERQGMRGEGRIFGTDITLRAVRRVASSAAPRTHVLEPSVYHPVTSAAPAPALRVASGDTIRTSTIDPYGIDRHGSPAAMPGNPATGLFYVVGALPGDTLAVHIKSLKPNRSTARMNLGLDPSVLAPGYVPQAGAVSDVFWIVDPATGTARLRTPSDKLKDFKVDIRPMLGVVSVALAGGRAVPNREIGEWGGNLDYPGIREGTTLYLPVFQPGALLYLGDGHARQSDGEITGQGLETSLDVEFEVRTIKGQRLPQPWAEDADTIMVSGIWGSVDGAVRRATTGMALWLKQSYELDDSEVAAVMGTSLELEIAAVIGAQSHVVAKVPKSVLAQIRPHEP